MTSTDSAIGYLTFLDASAKTKNTYPIKANLDAAFYSNFFANSLSVQENEIILDITKHAWPPNYYSNFPSPYNYSRKLSRELRIFDLNLNFLRKISLQDTIIGDEIFALPRPVVFRNKRGNYIVSTEFRDTMTFQPVLYGIEYSGLTGKILRMNSFALGTNNNIYQKNDSSYISHRGHDFHRYDQQLNLINTKNNYLLPSSFTYPRTSLIAYSKIRKYGNKHYSGGYYKIDSSSSPGDEKVSMILISSDGITSNGNIGLDTIYNHEIIYPNAGFGGRGYSLNLYDSKFPTQHFIGYNLVDCRTAGLTPCDTSSIMINCTDTLGTHKWSIILGGDAGYILTDVTATADSGCILLAMRHADSVYADGWPSLDVYYCKLDKFGSVQPNYLPTSSSFYQLPIIQELVLYPNPTTNELYFKTENIETYKVYNMQGAVVLSGKYNGRISTNQLTKGNYLIRGYTKAQELFLGKFTKE